MMPNRRSLTDTQVDEICALHDAGLDAKAIARKFAPVSDTTIRDWLRRKGRTIHSRLKLSQEQVCEAAQLYEAGFSTDALGAQFNVSADTIATALRKYGVVIKPRGDYRRLALREDAFDVLTPESSYFIGLLATDGCVTGHDDVVDEVKLGLKLDDSEHVEAFRRFLGSEHKVRLDISKHPTDPTREIGMCHYATHSKKLVQALALYGIIPRKTHTYAACGGVETSRDYWRGCVDGDGTLGIYGNDHILKFTSASRQFACQLRDFLSANNVRGSHSVNISETNRLGQREHYVLRLGASAALDAVALLYTDNVVALKRKERIAAEMIWRGSHGMLLGTIREPWVNPKALAWAEKIRTASPKNVDLLEET
jgi:hypothetical protein